MERRQALKTLALGVTSLTMGTGLGRATALAAEPAKPAAVPGATPAPPAGPFTLPPLGYGFDALEPFLDAATMQLHHDKHHAAYVTNLNKAVAGRKEVEGWSVERLVRDLAFVPDDIRSAVRNHAGGHVNHTMLWTSLKKDGAKAPSADLTAAINAAFGSFASCMEKLTGAAAGVFGSGWAWLSADSAGKVQVETSPNQDTPFSGGRTPLLGIDVWEHAYYLKYQNRRAEYLTAFANVIDWDAVSGRYRVGK